MFVQLRHVAPHEGQDLAERFETHRSHLRGQARRIHFGVWFIRAVDDLNDRVAAAKGRPVFEFHATEGLAP